MTRQTEDLIGILSKAPPEKAPISFGTALLGISTISLIITFSILRTLRPELMALSPPAGFFIKTLLLSGFVGTAFLYLREAGKPVPRFPHIMAAWIIPLALLALIAREWWMAASAKDVLSVLLLPNFKACLLFVSLYGIAGTAALTMLMKSYAPADERRAATWIGFGAAAAGAIGYSFHCPVDSPTFIALGYGIPVAGLTLFSRLAIPRFIRW